MRSMNSFSYRLPVKLRLLFLSRGFGAWLFLAAGCFASPVRAVAAISITIAPPSVNLSPGGMQQFTATVTGASDTSVTWTVKGGVNGGTILASGLYTAPGTAGSYSVIATSNADNTQIAAAVVSVAGFARTGLLNPSPATATLLNDGTVLYTDGAIGSAEIYDPVASASKATGSMSIPRVDYTATLLPNGKVLIAGGQSSGQVTAQAELYDPSSGTFAVTGSLAAPREGHTATLLLDGRVLIVGGDKGNCTSSCIYTEAEIYDPSTGTFNPTTGSLPQPPAIPANNPLGTAAAIRLLNGKVLIAGGGIGGAAELFDPATGLFAQTGALVNPDDGFAATLLPDGKVLFVTGGIKGAAAATAEIYDPAAGTFAATGNLNLARNFDTATLLSNGEVLIAGGWSTGPAELYDPATGKFTLTGSLQEPRVGQQATLLTDGTALIAGGTAPIDGLYSVEVYDPASKSFGSKSTFLKTARTDQASAQLPDGRLLLTGGEDFALSVLSSAEIYDPATGVSSLTGSMLKPRHGHTATLLPNGNVLIVGGFSDSSVTGSGAKLVSTAEIYNPAAGTFSSTSSPNLARAYHTATLLPSGQVLITGGATLGGSLSPTSSAELYDPAAQTFTSTANMSAVRYNHAATLMNDGRVLISDGMTVAGSSGSGIGLDEIYDPAAGQFLQAGPKVVISNPTAPSTASILLQNGQVLADNQSVFNSASDTLTVLTSPLNLQRLLQDYEFAPLPGGLVLATSNSYPVYLFDPISQTFSQGDSLRYHRSRPSLYVLPNHEVMVAGGASVAQVEFYVPSAANSTPAPGLSSLNPTAVLAGGAGFALQVNGSNFASGAVVNFNGAARQTTFVSATELSISVLASDIFNAGTVTITVTNPSDGSSGITTSNPLTLTILAVNVQPVVGVLSPASTTAGGPAFILLLTGNGFTQNSAVMFNGNSVPSSLLSLTQLQANIPASAIAIAGNYLVAVGNHGSNPTSVVSFPVNNPVPQESSLSPNSVTVGTASVTLNVIGSNFNSSSVVWVGLTAHATTFVSPTQVQILLAASDLANGGEFSVKVINPAPGGGSTSILTFTVADYTLAVPSPLVTVTAGQTAVFGLTVAPVNGGFANPITFTVAPLPPGASASFTPSATITPGPTSQNLTLSITTTAHMVSSVRSFPISGASFVLLVSFAGLGVALRKFFLTARKAATAQSATSWMPRYSVLFLLICAGGMAACANGGSVTSAVPQVNTSTGTPAGSYTVTVTATSGGVAHKASATLTVI